MKTSSIIRIMPATLCAAAAILLGAQRAGAQFALESAKLEVDDTVMIESNAEGIGSSIGADFGLGIHSWGHPDQGALVQWFMGPSDDPAILNVGVMVTGTIYVDRYEPGWALLVITYLDADNNVLEVRESDQVSGDGGNANQWYNQGGVGNDTLFGHPDLRRIQIELRSGPKGLPFGARGTASAKASSSIPTIKAGAYINNGKTDLGGGTMHFFGAPAAPGEVDMFLGDDGQIHARVKGTLFWDSSTAGAARLIIDFQNERGVTLFTTDVTEAAAAGGNAAKASNQTAYTRTFAHPELFQIRLRLGEFKDGKFVNSVYRFYSDWVCP